MKRDLTPAEFTTAVAALGIALDHALSVPAPGAYRLPCGDWISVRMMRDRGLRTHRSQLAYLRDLVSGRRTKHSGLTWHRALLHGRVNGEFRRSWEAA